MSTIVGREKIDHPSLGAAGGSALHVAIETIYTNVGNDMSARFKPYAAIANSVVTTVDHNFGVDFADLNIYLYTGTHPTLVRVSDPVASGWTIAATSGFLKTKIDITAPSSGGPHTFVLYVVHGSLKIDDLTDVNLTVAAEDGQALVYEASSTSWKAGASGDASFKIQSISTPNAVIKGGYILIDNGKELATYDGAGSASTDFGKDLTVSLTTILGSAPANATAYYLYIDLTTLAAAVTLSDNGRKVYAVVQSNFVLSTTAPDSIDLARYIPRAVIKSATTGTAWSGSGSAFATLAFLAGQTVDGSLRTFVRPEITQTAHGFTSSNLGAPLYLTSGGVYTLAKADAANTAEVVGLIYSITSANVFVLGIVGNITVNTAVSGGALVVGSTYYVSASTAGLITATEPSVVGQVSKPIGTAVSTTVLEFINMRGVTVGGTNALTSISLANNAVTSVQSLSSYQASEITGYVSLVGTSSQQFYFAAQVSKNAAGTDYNLSYQTSGETPPSGFLISVTTGGTVQFTLPSIAGFVSATVTYSLNAPAVGATFPLSVSEANLITKFQQKNFNGAPTVIGGDTLLSTIDATFKFAGLTIGKRYIIKARFYMDRSGSSSVRRFMRITIKNGATNIGQQTSDLTSDFYTGFLVIESLFTATATTIEFSANGAGGNNTYFAGDGTINFTTALLQEATGMTVTTEWT